MLSGVIPARTRLASSPESCEGRAEFLAKARIDKDALPSRVDNQDVVRDLDDRLQEVCLQHWSDFSVSGVHYEDRLDWYLPVAIRNHGRFEVAYFEAIEAMAVKDSPPDWVSA